MITVGLDFGTHQTKVCIEEKNGYETHYRFHRFIDLDGRLQYTFPSILCIKPDGLLEYGFVKDIEGASYKRYFKQAVFRDNNSPGMSLWEAARYSIWYLSYILFDLIESCDEEFNIQMGVPTDSSGIDDRKAIAVSIIASAYRLVEIVFNKNKKKFLTSTYDDLVRLTEIMEYSDRVKRKCGLLVFPEAYACLMPLIARGKIAHGMNLVIDIGGGTTDISFFKIEEKDKDSGKYHPQVYEFYSINEGLNYLIESDNSSHKSIIEMIRFFSSRNIESNKQDKYFQDILDVCQDLDKKLKSEWKKQNELYEYRLTDKLKNRPIVYTGGGSTIKNLQNTYLGFKDKKVISYDVWKSREFIDKSIFDDSSLCPILSTAYGLSISVKSDDIVKKPFKDVFLEFRGMSEEKEESSFGSALGGFSYTDDWDALK